MRQRSLTLTTRPTHVVSLPCDPEVPIVFDSRLIEYHISGDTGGGIDGVAGLARKVEDSRLIAAWRTNHRATVFLVEHLPVAVWSRKVPGIPRLTVGMIAAHIHNSRCSWIRSLGARHGVKVPRRVDLRRVRPAELVKALSRSSKGMVELIELGMAHGGRVPRATWQNFPTDLEHFLSYFAAHEGHHRGQLCMVARQLGQRLPRKVADGVWEWNRLSRD